LTQVIAIGDDGGELAGPEGYCVCGVRGDCANAAALHGAQKSGERKEGATTGDGVESTCQTRGERQPK